MTTISAIIITKNEEANIRACLESLTWVDEIVVVDSGSSDRTEPICREFGARFYSHDWPGFGPQKNRALDYAISDWVLSIDADERVTSELRTEIREVLASPAAMAYELPRLSWYCGRFMRHSGWRPDYVLRLFRRGRARFTEHLVHERVEATGESVGRLRHELHHYSYRDVDQVLATLRRYATLGAAQKYAAGGKAGLLQAISRGFWCLFYTYILRAGFLDGRQGIMLAISNAEVTYYKYLKLCELSEGESAEAAAR